MLNRLRRLFSRKKSLRFPNGIPRQPQWMKDNPLRPLMTDEDIDAIRQELWNGREHG